MQQKDLQTDKITVLINIKCIVTWATRKMKNIITKI